MSLLPLADPVIHTLPVRSAAPDAQGWIVARLLVGDMDGLCVVSDLTVFGARMMSVIPLTVDTRFTLDLGEDRVVAGKVHWVDPTRSGIEFDPPLDPALLQAIVRSDSAPPRFKRCIEVSVGRHGRTATALLVEIAPTGACLKLAHEPWIRQGAEIEVHIDGFYPADAEVNWIEGERVAVEFRTPIQLWRLDNQLRKWGRECDSCASQGCHGAARPLAR